MVQYMMFVRRQIKVLKSNMYFAAIKYSDLLDSALQVW